MAKSKARIDVDCDPVIVLDPGHRGTVTGCSYNGWYESSFVYDVAEAVKASWPLDYIDVVLTRGRHDETRYGRRAIELVKGGVDEPLALLHLHVDSCPGVPNARGTWCVGDILDPYTSDLGNLIVSAENAPCPDQSLKNPLVDLGHSLARRAVKVLGAFRSRDVLAAAQLLVELGFITNDGNRELFLGSAGAEHCANHLTLALVAWIESLK